MSDDVLDEATLATLLETIGGDESFLADLVGTYLSDGPVLVLAMRTGLAGDDRVALRRAAHTLKSTSASLGALPLSAMCREIEAEASAGDAAVLGVRIEAAASGYEAASAALRARLDGPPHR